MMSEVGWVVTVVNRREQALLRGRPPLSRHAAQIFPFIRRSQKSEVICEKSSFLNVVQ